MRTSSLLCVATLLCCVVAVGEEAEPRGPVSLGVTANRGPSANEGSLIVPVAANARCISILTQEESVNNKPDGSPYIMVGIPDGLGMFDNGDGTMTVLMNHEINSTATNPGKARRHHGANGQGEGLTTLGTMPTAGKGAFVSRFNINHTNLIVNEGSDLARCGKVNLWDATSQKFKSNPNAAGVAGTDITTLTDLDFSRLCSADLANGTAYRNGITTTSASAFQFATAAPAGLTLGTRARLFLSGEEGAPSRAFAFIAGGPNAGTAFQLPGMGQLDWENLVACPAEQDKTVVIGLDDTGPTPGGYVVVWVGNKTANGSSTLPTYPGIGTDVDQAGLLKGTLYGIKANGVATEDRTTGVGLAKNVEGAFTLVALPDQTLAGANTRTTLQAAAATAFLRPEDGAWDPVAKNTFYFVTTDRFDTVKNPEGATRTNPVSVPGTARTTAASSNPAGQVGRSRLWKLVFSDITKPETGGKVTMLLDGTEAQQMMDNIGVDARGENILIQEDSGGCDYLGKILNYNIKTGALTTIAQFDPARFDPKVAVNNTTAERLLTVDEEASGIIDCTPTLGTGWFLATLQIHASRSGEAVERGQLVAIFNPSSAAPPAVNTTSSSARLTANPSSPNVAQSTTITVTGTTTTGGQIRWEVDFGDGTKFTATSATASGSAFSTTKTWSALGSYKVTATGTDTLTGQSTVQTITVVVKDTIRSGRLLLRLGFDGKDDAILTGQLPITPETSLAGTITVDIGGFKKDFSINEDGSGRADKDMFKIFKKHKPKGVTSLTARFLCKIFDEDLAASLSDEGLIDKDADRESKTVRSVINMNGTPYDATLTVIYSAQKGKGGRTR